MSWPTLHGRDIQASLFGRGIMNQGTAILERELNDILRQEMTWTEVATGLTNIIIGHVIIW